MHACTNAQMHACMHACTNARLHEHRIIICKLRLNMMSLTVHDVAVRDHRRDIY